jgi:hypothetical protein
MVETEKPPTSNRAARLALVGVIALALVVRLAPVQVINNWQAERLAGSEDYLAIADSFVRGGGLVLPPTGLGDFKEPTLAWSTPGYPLILAGGQSRHLFESGEDSLVRTALLVQAVLGALATLAVAWMTWRLAGMWAAVIAAALFAFDPYQAYFVAMVAPMTLLVLGLALVTGAGLRFLGTLESGGRCAWLWAVAAGLALAAATYLEAWAAGLAVVAALAALLSGRRKRLLAGWAIGVAAMVIALAPWIIRNEEKLGAPVLSTSTGRTLFAGTVAADETPPPEVSKQAQALDEAGRDMFYGWQAVGRIADAPLKWLALAGGRAGRLWNGSPLVADDRGPLSPMAGYTGFLPAVALAAAGLWALRCRRAMALWLLAVPIFITLACGVLAEPTYARLAMMPSLTVLAGVGLMAMLGRTPIERREQGTGNRQ